MADIATQHDYDYDSMTIWSWQANGSSQKGRLGEQEKGGKDDPAITYVYILHSSMNNLWEKLNLQHNVWAKRNLINEFLYPTDYKDELKNNHPSLLPPPLEPGVWFMGSTQQGVGATPSAPLIL